MRQLCRIACSWRLVYESTTFVLSWRGSFGIAVAQKNGSSSATVVENPEGACIITMADDWDSCVVLFQRVTICWTSEDVLEHSYMWCERVYAFAAGLDLHSLVLGG